MTGPGCPPGGCPADLPLDALAQRVIEGVGRMAGQAPPHITANFDQWAAATRDTLTAHFAVDLTDPAAARTVMSVYDLCAGVFHTTGRRLGFDLAMVKSSNQLAVAALAAAHIHTPAATP